MEQQGKTRDNKGTIVMTKDLKDTRASKGTSTDNKGQRGITSGNKRQQGHQAQQGQLYRYECNKVTTCVDEGQHCIKRDNKKLKRPLKKVKKQQGTARRQKKIRLTRDENKGTARDDLSEKVYYRRS
jgi:hypothetical protein